MNDIQVMSEILELRRTLSKISDISYNFRILQKEFPLDSISDTDKHYIVDAYRELITAASEAVEGWKP